LPTWPELESDRRPKTENQAQLVSERVLKEFGTSSFHDEVIEYLTRLYPSAAIPCAILVRAQSLGAIVCCNTSLVERKLWTRMENNSKAQPVLIKRI